MNTYETQATQAQVTVDRSRVKVDGKTVRNDVPVTELPARANRAARLACGDRKVYSDANREDCASHLVLTILADMDRRTVQRPIMDRVQIKRASNSADVRDLLRWIDRAESDYRQSFPVDTIPAAMVTGSRLFGMASHWRRSEDSRRDREAADAAERDRQSGETRQQVTEDPATLGTPLGARERALTLCGELGLRPLRKRDAAMYTTVYAACRATAGLESKEIAEELALTWASYRQHIARAPDYFSSRVLLPTQARYFDKLQCADVGFIRSTGLPDSAFKRIRVGEKGDVFPNVSTRTRVPIMEVTTRTVSDSNGARQQATTHLVGYVTETSRGANGRSTGEVTVSHTRTTRAAWDKLPVSRRRTAAWTQDLPARAHTAYGAQAVRQRTRAASKSPGQSHADRTAAGIPGFTWTSPARTTPSH